MSPVDPLKSPVIRMSTYPANYNSEIVQPVYRPVESTLPNPLQSIRRIKYLSIGVVLTLFVLSPFLIYGAQKYQKAMYENSLIDRHRIVNP